MIAFTSDPSSHPPEMSDLQSLKEFVLRQADIVDKPGKLLYSAGTTLRPHEIYFLGTKPGGTLPNSIRQSLADLDDGRNEYLDYSWEGRPPGQQKVQKQVQRFIAGLGYELRTVPATNIVLTRDRSIDTHPDLDGDAKRCWPIHLFMMGMVKPRAVVAFGSGESASPFAYLREFLAPTKVESISAGQGTFQCHRFCASIEGRPTNLVFVPHLTRYSPYKRPEILTWVKEWIVAA